MQAFAHAVSGRADAQQDQDLLGDGRKLSVAAQGEIDEREGDRESEDHELKTGDAGLAGLFVEDGVEANLIGDDGVQHDQAEGE